MNLVPKFNSNELERIEKKAIIQSVNIDSMFRSNHRTTLSNDVLMRLPTNIPNVISMRLRSFEIPNTWYTFNSTNNYFYIQTKFTDASGNIDEKVYTITISEGNYDAGDLVTQINTFFKYTEQHNVNYLEHLYFEIDDFSNKTRIRYKTYNEAEIDQIFSVLTNENVFDNDEYNENILKHLEYSILFFVENPVCAECPEYETCGWTLGFRKTYYENIDLTRTKKLWSNTLYGVVESESIYAVNKMNYFYLVVDDFVGNSKEGFITGNDIRDYRIKNILARIQIKYGSLYVNVDNAEEHGHRQRDYKGPVNIEKLRLQLIDKYGKSLEVNGSDYSCVLEFVQAR